MPELTIRDVIAWVQSHGQHPPSGRVWTYKWHAGYFTQSPTSRKDEYVYIRDAKRRRKQYAQITQQALDRGDVQIPGENGRYVDIREVIAGG